MCSTDNGIYIVWLWNFRGLLTSPKLGLSAATFLLLSLVSIEHRSTTFSAASRHLLSFNIEPEVFLRLGERNIWWTSVSYPYLFGCYMNPWPISPLESLAPRSHFSSSTATSSPGSRRPEKLRSFPSPIPAISKFAHLTSYHRHLQTVTIHDYCLRSVHTPSSTLHQHRQGWLLPLRSRPPGTWNLSSN